ncbi:MAG: redox-regulated ATPase YchF [Spirochaetales bacterium]|nr:redox-regulated ATPase YchF [Spirochaetales bacterium]
MNIGLVGLSKSGKTTIFNALTGETAEVSAYQSGRVEPNRAIVQVEDERVAVLSEMYQPKKTIYAQLELVDFAGMSGNADNGEIFTGEAVAAVKTTDALALVLRSFASEEVDSQHGPANPAEELETLNAEFLLSDQIVVEKRLAKVREDIKKGKKDADLPAEEKLLALVLEHLEAGKPIRELEINPDQRKALSGYQFLTSKPIFVILNSDEERYGSSSAVLEEIEKTCEAIEFAGKFEMELSGLDPEDAAVFMEDIGITGSARARLSTSAYAILGYISFFTVGEDEVRAWTIRSGATAVDAAGTIHSDLARGFIRAECFSYDDLHTLGTEKALKEKGLIRLEGKTYIAQDGDILNIRFSV